MIKENLNEIITKESNKFLKEYEEIFYKNIKQESHISSHIKNNIINSFIKQLNLNIFILYLIPLIISYLIVMFGIFTSKMNMNISFKNDCLWKKIIMLFLIIHSIYHVIIWTLSNRIFILECDSCLHNNITIPIYFIISLFFIFYSIAWFVGSFDSDKWINKKNIQVFLYERILYNNFVTILDEKLENSINKKNKEELDFIKKLAEIKSIEPRNYLASYKDKVIDYKTIEDKLDSIEKLTNIKSTSEKDYKDKVIDYIHYNEENNYSFEYLEINSVKYKKEKDNFQYQCQYLIFNDQFSKQIPDDILDNILGIRNFSFSLIRRSYNIEDQDSYLKIYIPFHITRLYKPFLSLLNNDFYFIATIIFISYVIIITIICILYKNKQIQSLTNKLQYIFMKYEESLKEKEIEIYEHTISMKNFNIYFSLFFNYIE